MHALATILAAVEGEKSEVPYFIAGGLFALWAVGISLFALRSPDFPKSKGVGRAALGVSFALAASTLGLLIAVSA
jgi:hypothetical protein